MKNIIKIVIMGFLFIAPVANMFCMQTVLHGFGNERASEQQYDEGDRLIHTVATAGGLVTGGAMSAAVFVLKVRDFLDRTSPETFSLYSKFFSAPLQLVTITGLYFTGGFLLGSKGLYIGGRCLRRVMEKIGVRKILPEVSIIQSRPELV